MLAGSIPADWGFHESYLKVPRVVIDLLAPNPPLLAVYIVLARRARYEDGQAFTAHGLQDLKIGDAMFGTTELAAQCGVSRQQVRTAIQRLKSLQLLTTRSTNAGTIATLVRYKETYPPKTSEQPADAIAVNQQSTSSQPAANQQPTTKETKEKRETKRRETGDRVLPGLGPDHTPHPEPSDHAIVRSHYVTLWQNAHSEDPEWNGKQGRWLNDLLGKHEALELCRRLDVMFEKHRAGWPSSPDFATFKQHIDKFIRSANGKARSLEREDHNAPPGMRAS